MYIVGELDLEKYKCVESEIITSKVVITSKQIEHIKSRHPNDYELFKNYLYNIIKDPDYIVEANKYATALVLKEIEIDKKMFKLVLRLVTPKDDDTYMNSIITFMKIDEKEWNRLIRNKRILYKKE